MPGVGGPAAVLVTRGVPAPVLERLSAGCQVEVWDGEGAMPRAELLDRVAGKAGVVAMLTDRVDGELLDRAGPRLRVVANYAVGHDNLDLDACTARGVLATNTPDVVTEATADLTWALLLASARRVADGDRFLRSRRPWIWGRSSSSGPRCTARPLAWSGLAASAGRWPGGPPASACRCATAPATGCRPTARPPSASPGSSWTSCSPRPTS